MSYLYYILGVFLLVTPAGLITPGRLTNVTMRELVERTRNRLGWMHWANFFDFARGLGGLLLVKEAFRAIDPSAGGSVVTLVTVALASFAGLGLQQFFYPSDDDDMVAPVAYAVGLTFAFLPLKIAALALPLGMVGAFGVHSIGMGFVMSALAVGGLGYVFRVSPLLLATGCFLLCAPVALAGIMQRRLVLSVRSGPLTKAAPLREVSLSQGGR